MSIHRFSDSASACDAHQQNLEIEFGDTLVVEPEGVVAVACLYPFAVSSTQGEFYAFTWDDPITDPLVLLQLIKGIRSAVEEGRRLGIAVNPSFEKFVDELQ